MLSPLAEIPVDEVWVSAGGAPSSICSTVKSTDTCDNGSVSLLHDIAVPICCVKEFMEHTWWYDRLCCQTVVCGLIMICIEVSWPPSPVELCLLKLYARHNYLESYRIRCCELTAYRYKPVWLTCFLFETDAHTLWYALCQLVLTQTLLCVELVPIQWSLWSCDGTVCFSESVPRSLKALTSVTTMGLFYNVITT